MPLTKISFLREPQRDPISMKFYYLYFDDRRRLSAYLGTAIFALASLMAFEQASLAAELNWLPPGLALMGLSRLLRREMGQRWSLLVFNLGAFCVFGVCGVVVFFPDFREAGVSNFFGVTSHCGGELSSLCSGLPGESTSET